MEKLNLIDTTTENPNWLDKKYAKRNVTTSKTYILKKEPKSWK